MNMTIGSLFSGIIGGLELGLERAGLGPVVWQCEIDPFCRSVLAKHWPHAVRHEDVREVGHATATRASILCGGFPCQDVSLAGKGAGLGGARSGLWFEYARIIGELVPSIVVIENVLGLRTRGLRRVLADLSDLGFDAEWCDLSASEIGAPHRRQRLFIVATHPNRVVVRDEPGWLGRSCWARASVASVARAGGETAAHTDREGQSQQGGAIGEVGGWPGDGSWWPPVSPVRRVDDGIPNRSHGRRLKALGNAVHVDCAYVVGMAIAGTCEVLS